MFVKERKYLKELVKELGGKCVICGATHSRGHTNTWLHFAHIKYTPTGGPGRGLGRKGRGLWRYMPTPNKYKYIREHPECFALMCEQCHKVFDKIYEQCLERGCPKSSEEIMGQMRTWMPKGYRYSHGKWGKYRRIEEGRGMLETIDEQDICD